MNKTVLQFGLLSGAVATAMMLATLPFLAAADHRRMDLVGYTAMVASVLLVYFGVRAYRAGAGGGRLAFARGLAVGLLITIVSALVQVAAFQVVYFRLVPQFGDRFAACMVERAREEGAGAEEIAETTRRAADLKRLYDNPWTNAALTFVQPLPIGLVAAVISAALLRTRRGAAAAGAPDGGAAPPVEGRMPS